MSIALYDPLALFAAYTWPTPVEWIPCDSFGSFLQTTAQLHIYVASEWQLQTDRAQLSDLDSPLLVQSVTHTLADLGWEGDIRRARFNGWKGLFSPTHWEIAGSSSIQLWVETHLQVTPVRCPDQVGFIAPRVLAAIINEACYALAAGVSSQEDIDTAMKLGTNYPHGPFEWASLIGWQSVYDLLFAMSKENPAHQPHEIMQKYLGS
jgi:3-hydroxybutyryl-CoA dehydrogenase